MAQSLASIIVHLIFSTKNREPFLHRDVHLNYFCIWLFWLGARSLTYITIESLPENLKGSLPTVEEIEEGLEKQAKFEQ